MLLACLTAAAFIARGAALGQEPLSGRIDQLVVAAAGGVTPAPRSGDAEFCRRVWLDLAGCIPPVAELRRFVADGAADKREQLVVRLLASPEHPRRMAELLHVLLMERRGDHDEWQKFLRAACEANRPWDELVRQILVPSADQETTRGAAFFIAKRLETYGQNAVDYPGLVRDVGRLFLGVDLQCAQCHDHLLVRGYKQRDFQGLLAVYQNVTAPGGAFPKVVEKPKFAKLEFVSVFQNTPQATGPRVPGGREFDPPAAEDPNYKPLALLGTELCRADNPLFARNIANRVWAIMLGRGLVEPLDLHHADNPPSHPALLDLLAAEIVSHGFDLRWLLREIARSETYQRSSCVLAASATPADNSFVIAAQRRLSPEQLYWSVRQALGNEGAAQNQPAAADEIELRKAFLAAFSNPAREPEAGHRPSVQAALFLVNSPLVEGLLEPRDNNLVARAVALNEPQQIAVELYESILSRPPTANEQAELAEYLRAATDRRRAIANAAWALVASAEFCLNH